MAFYTHYWTSSTWDQYGNRPILYTAGNGLIRRGLKVGDHVFIVTNKKGRVYVGGRVTVKAIVGKTEARKRFNDPWIADEFVIPASSHPFQIDVAVPVRTLKNLHFSSGKKLTLVNGLIDQQALRGLRQLSATSANELSHLLAAKVHHCPKPARTKSRAATATQRLSVDAVGGTFDTIFSGVEAKDRGLWERYLAEVLHQTAARYPSRWVLTLHKTYIRLIVGMVMCVQFRRDNGVVALVARDGAAANLGLSEQEYKNAPGCGEGSVPFSAAARGIKRIRKANRAAIEICASKHPGTGGHRRAHSSAAVKYLATIIGRPLPDPSYFVLESNSDSDEATELRNRAEEDHIRGREDLTPTQKEQIILARRGQGLFRKRLERIESHCRVTELSDRTFLRASHIKPWFKSDNYEKLDGHNGLLLAPHVDMLFDRGWISFDDDGNLLLSKHLNPRVLSSWSITASLNVGTFTPEQRMYLAWHRDYFGFLNGK